ncbi:hypothetical protein CAPTEDRAFT_157542 [Capitella teleta]|uniref:Peptidase M14 domain-containing protein n=1 Tax=Capitella teleta TaxID=283909 RepID=R7UJ33_CAPTE|nr:hypothetical protein CAPTEDRAFT_157542 [Capitella teleta]|eukprot:ELU06078.1 hypothetical protein CAPTEDRAFT_157542 [Capitella teleta]
MKTYQTATIVLSLLFLANDVNTKSYNGDQVWRVYAESNNDIDAIHQLSHYGVHAEEIDLWQDPTLERPAHLLVPPLIADEIAASLANKGLNHDVMISNVGTLIEDEAKERQRNRIQSKKQARRRKRQTFEGMKDKIVGIYAEYDEIVTWMKELSTSLPHLVSLTTAEMTTSEGRSIYLMKIGRKRPYQKPAFWLDGGIHAREWVSPSSVVFVVSKLVEDYLKGYNTDLLDNLDWYILPVVNPDGYVFTHVEDRLWRKNRRYYASYNLTHPNEMDKICAGVDLNRNFPYQWEKAPEYGRYHCSIVFAGPYPASEAETQVVIGFINERKDDIKAFVSLHSYGQLVLTRWAHTSEERPADVNELDRVGRLVTDAISNTFNNNYTFGVPGSILYSYAGGSPDWAKGVANITYTYAMELRASIGSGFGFLLPENQTLDTGAEIFNGLKVVADQVISQHKHIVVNEEIPPTNPNIINRDSTSSSGQLCPMIVTTFTTLICGYLLR